MSDHLVKLAEAWVAAGRNHQIERGYGPAAEERAHRDMLAAEFAFRQAAQALADKVKELTFAGEQMMETLKGHQAEISRLQASNANLTEAVGRVLTWAHSVHGVVVVREDHMEHLRSANIEARRASASLETEKANG